MPFDYNSTMQGIAPPILPLVWMSLHFSKVCSSIVFGNLSDKVGRKKLIFAGWVLYALVYAGFAFVASAWQAWCLFLIYGLYFGLTEGSEKAMVADMVAEEKRGTAYGLYNLAIGITVFPASLLFGLMWDQLNAPTAFLISAGVSILAAILLLTVRPGALSTEQ